MRGWRLVVAFQFLLIPALVWCASGQEIQASAEQIVARMTSRNSQREALLGAYSGMRRYAFQNDGMAKHAEILVRITGDGDGSKHFEVLSEGGWQAADKHVLRAMVLSEQETSQSAERERIRLAADNYTFQLEGTDEIDGRPVFILDVSPKRADKYLFKGRIWVDTADYAVVKVDGEPAKNPSFWTRHVHFVQLYKKDGPFWFPARTESVTEAFLFGKTDVSIEYFDYKPLNRPVVSPTPKQDASNTALEETANQVSQTSETSQK